MIQLVLATHNAHKVEELRSILGPMLDGLELVAYDGPEPVEDGETFEDNALIKARAAAAHTGLPAIADDSGIAVTALDGEPGIHSARYAGTRKDADNVALLLANMERVTNRSAHFVCAAAFVHGETECVVRGEWYGTVLKEVAGENGFGYDPVFRPKDFDVSSAELTPEQKNAISHRARAFRGLMPVVRRALLPA
jgi:XTP/dITP diphosphohydrolase